MSIESTRKRLEAATPGPWAAGPFSKRSVRRVNWPPKTSEFIVLSGHDYLFDIDTGCQEEADAELIAHAPTDLALLLEVAEAAQALITVLHPPATSSRPDWLRFLTDAGWQYGEAEAVIGALAKLGAAD